jgi:PLP dependent protein
MAAACLRAGRPPAALRLVAVTKSVDAPTAAALAGLGVAELGESRAQSLSAKLAAWPAAVPRPRWHFLGHLQRNKARAVVRLADEIHSLDSLPLLETLERVAVEEQRRPAVWLEVDLTGAPDRTGLSRAQLPELLSAARTLAHLRLQGLMTLAPLPTDEDRQRTRAREVFGELRDLAAELDPAPFENRRVQLSMGMSSDFEVAIECGADLVRVGSALFEGLPSAPSLSGGRP